MPTSDPNQMLSTTQAASLLGLQPCTLAAWREDGSQPDLTFFKFGKAVRYRYADVLAFIETRRTSNTVLARALNSSAPSRPAPAKRRPGKKTRHAAPDQPSLL